MSAAPAARPAERPISDIHKSIHASALLQAQRARLRGDGAMHARMLAGAATARFYFARLRAIGS